jgi:chromosome segregation ATPase
MNEERAPELPGRSFEERVFARFDSLDARFDSMDADVKTMELRFETRFDRVEERLEGLDIRVQALESRALDTKPIWERALSEILEVRKGVEDLNRKIDVLNQDVLQVRADQRLVHKRLDSVETRLQ